MKSRLTTLTLIGLLSTTTGALAHEDYSEAGSLHWISHVSQQGSNPDAVRLERESQRNWTSPDANNQAEGTGGLALRDLQKATPAPPEQMMQKRENEKLLDRGKDNHEEGIGGHGLYEATKGR